MADNLRVMNNQLLPCPFCGGDAHLAWYNYGEEHVVVECENFNCLSAVCGAKTPEEAVKRWNSRMKENNLKRCPFCGGVARLEHFDNGECEMYQVKCKNPQCQAETPTYNESEDVISIWNNRNNQEGAIE